MVFRCNFSNAVWWGVVECGVCEKESRALENLILLLHANKVDQWHNANYHNAAVRIAIYPNPPTYNWDR